MAVDLHIRQDLEHIATVEGDKIEEKRDFPSSFEDNLNEDEENMVERQPLRLIFRLLTCIMWIFLLL